jgi:hypothetical protein
MFYKYSGFLHGTRGFLNQIEENICSEVYVKDNFEEITNKIYDNRMRSWLLNRNNKTNINGILKYIDFNNISDDLKEFLHLNYPNQKIKVGNIAFLDNIGNYFILILIFFKKSELNDILEKNFYDLFKFMELNTNYLSVININQIEKKCIIAYSNNFIFITERVMYDFID